MKVVFTLVAIALGALVVWFGVFYEEPQPQSQVVVISHPWYAASMPKAGSSAQSEKATENSVAALVKDSPASHDEKYKEYKRSKAYQAFWDRRNEIFNRFWRVINDPRIKEGLDPLPNPEVIPTHEERAAMIVEFQAGIREINEDVRQGYDSNIGRLFRDLNQTGIPASDLGEEIYRLATVLGQARADFDAKSAQRLLDRGCHGTAGFIIDMSIHQIARGLGDTTNMGYAWLDEQIINAMAPGQATQEQAGEDEMLREAAMIAERQRAQAVNCSMG